MPVPRPTPEGPPPGSRAAWPTTPPDDDWAAPGPVSRPLSTPPARVAAPPPPAAPRTVTPPWLADDLRPPEPPEPVEPPSLRLVEPTLPEELRYDLSHLSWSDPPPLRLVDPDESIPRSIPPVGTNDGDGDLLIFAQARSAWFTDHDEDPSWNPSIDAGWQAAERAARPTVGVPTEAGLPRRVPHANLVPGSPPEHDRPLRVVRDPAIIAAHTSGYFDGWRRGQEVGGYPLGTRANRPAAAAAWDFARDDRMSG